MKLVALLAIAWFSSSPDSVQTEIYFKQFKKHQYSNVDSALICLELSIEFAGRMEKRTRQGELLREKGIYLKDQGKYDESEQALKKAIAIFEGAGERVLEAITYNNLGVTYWRSGDSEKALQQYFKSRDMNMQLNNRSGLVRNFMAIGNHYAKEHEYEPAIENYEQAMKFVDADSRSQYAFLLENTGNIYNDTKFKGFNTDKAVELYEQSLKVYHELKDSLSLAGLYVNIGLVHENRGQLDEAKRQYLRAIDLQQRLGLTGAVAATYVNLGNVFLKKDSVTLARNSFWKGYTLATSLKNAPTSRTLARKLSTCFAREGKFEEALRYELKYDSMDEILFNKQKEAAIQELETKYETEKKQAEINLTTGQRDSAMITLIIALILTAVIVMIYSQRRKAVEQLRERDKVLMNKKVDELLREQEIRSLRSYLAGQEEERKRIASDLHDRLGSTLSATKLFFTSINNSTEVMEASLQKAHQLLDTAVEEVREISHNLLSGSITKFGLKTALVELKDTISGNNRLTMTVLFSDMDNRLDGKVELNVYRIVQELVSNILKHAEASDIVVQLNRVDHELVLTVEDNGKGFNPMAERNGVGLSNIESRVQSLDGSMNIDSGLGNGTTITITIPLKS